jgi:hypothetical protein
MVKKKYKALVVLGDEQVFDNGRDYNKINTSRKSNKPLC